MSRENRFLKPNVNYSRFCADPLPGISLVEICDRRRVLVENHMGIVSYGCNEIRIKVRYGNICVCGESLKISKMSKEKLVILGKIHGVTLQGCD